MTVTTLYKKLDKLIKGGHARKPVCVNKRSFQHPLEDDGCVILEIEDIGLQWIGNIDGDGFTQHNQDGSESGRMTLVIDGGYEDE